MTPTLFGRWQTRLFLLATVGIVISLPFYLGLIGTGSNQVYFWVLGYVAIFGIVWDVIYDYLQKLRWDRDWPALFQLLAGIWEAIFLVFLFKVVKVPLPGVADLNLRVFALHYSLVWLVVFVVSQSLMRIIFPRWRFRGGQLL